MRLEDAFLYLVVDFAATPADRRAGVCAAAIAGGADVLELRDARGATRAGLEAAAEICRRDDALLVVGSDAALAAELGADGVRLDGADGSVAAARGALSPTGLVGLSSRTLDEARLALAVGADYLLHEAGTGARADFAALGARAGVPLFAGGLAGLEDARRVTAAGPLRLCVGAGLVDLAGDVTGQVAEYSRLLGRMI